MSTLTIRHTHAEGTVLEGSSKGDGVNVVLLACKSHGVRWRWWRDGGVFYIQASRFRRADRARIEKTASLLREEGFEVEIEVDDLDRVPVAEQEADRRARAEARVEGLTARAERLERESDARFAAAKEIGDHIPMGQPILVGHHSEGRHRRTLARIDSLSAKGLGLHREAKDAGQRAAAAAANQRHRENAGTVQRRLDKLRADQRRATRGIEERGPYATDEQHARTVEHWTPIREELDEKIAYWEAFLAELEANGVKLWGKDDFQKGDYVLMGPGDSMGPVKRVNPKSVTVPHPHAQLDRYPWTVPYDKITGRYRPGVDPTFQEQAKAAQEPAKVDEPEEAPDVEDASEREDRAPFWSDSVY